MSKSLHNTDANGTTKNVRDVQFWGDGDAWKLICKASSESEGWMKSTKAMQIKNKGVIVQVTTQQKNDNGTYSLAEAITFVPFAQVEEETHYNKVLSRKLI
jgi:hypothetical protein